jgi:hypothetical protein
MQIYCIDLHTDTWWVKGYGKLYLEIAYFLIFPEWQKHI